MWKLWTVTAGSFSRSYSLKQSFQNILTVTHHLKKKKNSKLFTSHPRTHGIKDFVTSYLTLSYGTVLIFYILLRKAIQPTSWFHDPVFEKHSPTVPQESVCPSWTSLHGDKKRPGHPRAVMWISEDIVVTLLVSVPMHTLWNVFGIAWEVFLSSPVERKEH